MTFSGAGGNEVVRLAEHPDPVACADYVVVRTEYAGLNPADILQREGRYPAPAGSPADIPGLEVAGVVVARGEHVTLWAPGQRVFGIVGGGGLADHVLVHERLLVEVPDGLDDREAAATPEAFVTAHDALFTQAGLRPGETLVVHGAGGGVGSAACQLGVAVGARTIAVVRSPAVRGPLGELGAEVVDEGSFERAVLEATDGYGADVVVELVGSIHFPANFEILATGGRIVVVSAAAGQEATLPLRTLMQRRAQVRGSVLRSRPLEQKATAVRKFEREVVPLLRTGRLRPLVDSVFPAEEITDAFDRLASPGKLGKVLIGFAASTPGRTVGPT